MHKGAILAALTALGAAAFAFAAKPPDTVTTSAAAYARRGSLGANDYVATNVAPCKSAYRILRVTDGRLRDRAVNVVTVTNDVTFTTPSRRLVVGYARSFCVSISVEAEGDCRLSLDGAAKVYTPDGAGDFSFAPGKHVMQLLEIGDNEYMAETRELIETEGR